MTRYTNRVYFTLLYTLFLSSFRKLTLSHLFRLSLSIPKPHNVTRHQIGSPRCWLHCPVWCHAHVYAAAAAAGGVNI